MSQGETGSLFYVLSSSRTVPASSCHDSLTGPVHLNIICPEKKKTHFFLSIVNYSMRSCMSQIVFNNLNTFFFFFFKGNAGMYINYLMP